MMSVAPLQFLLLVCAVWVNRRQLEIIEFLQEEDRILREQLGGRRLRFTVIDLESRRVHIAAVVRQPHAAWIQQIARNLVDNVDGFLNGKRYLLHDRHPLFTDAFRAVLRTAGVKCLKLPAGSPNLNAIAERFVLSRKSECPDKLVPLGERHLRLAISEFIEHYQPTCRAQRCESVCSAGRLGVRSVRSWTGSRYIWQALRAGTRLHRVRANQRVTGT